MAEDKKGFVLYADLIHTVSKMPNEKAGELLKHILEYVNDKEPETDDLIVQLTFEPIKQQLKRDLKKYESTKKERSISGQLGNLKRYHKHLYDRVKSDEITLETALKIVEDNKNSHSDTQLSHSDTKLAVTDTVKVTVKDTVKDIYINKQRTEDFDLFWSKYPVKNNKKSAKKKFLKLAQKDVDKILQTIDYFVSYKPFKDYNHPNPTTYINNERWNDELKNTKTVEQKKKDYNDFIKKSVTF